MKINDLAIILLAALTMSGCARTSGPYRREPLVPPSMIGIMSPSLMEFRLNRLSRSCNMDVEERLKAADDVMELLTRDAFNADGSLRAAPNDKIYAVGNSIYDLTNAFYQNRVTPEQCRGFVSQIRLVIFSSPGA